MIHLRRSRFLCSAALLAALLFPKLAGAGTPDTTKTPVLDDSTQIWTQPLLGGGVKANDAYVDGNMFFTLPLWSTLGKDHTLGGDYLFLEPYSSWGEKGEVTASLGMSWRHLFSDEPVSALQKSQIEDSTKKAPVIRRLFQCETTLKGSEN